MFVCPPSSLSPQSHGLFPYPPIVHTRKQHLGGTCNQRSGWLESCGASAMNSITCIFKWVTCERHEQWVSTSRQGNQRIKSRQWWWNLSLYGATFAYDQGNIFFPPLFFLKETVTNICSFQLGAIASLMCRLLFTCLPHYAGTRGEDVSFLLASCKTVCVFSMMESYLTL